MPKDPPGQKRPKDLADASKAGEVSNKGADDGEKAQGIQAVSARRQPAGAMGLTSISPDFDDPLPDDLQRLFEGR